MLSQVMPMYYKMTTARQWADRGAKVRGWMVVLHSGDKMNKRGLALAASVACGVFK
jgi:hypothetical protein